MGCCSPWPCIVAVAGITAAYSSTSASGSKAVEPTLFAKGWYYDSSIAAFMGGPGRAGVPGRRPVDARVVDGAVNGVGTLLDASAPGSCARLQTGYVRTYAAGLGVGAVLLLGGSS